MVWTYLLGLAVWIALEGSGFWFNAVPQSSHYLLFIGVSSLPLENICAYNPWLLKSFYFIDEILSLESGLASLMKHVLLVIILRKHLLILVQNLFIMSLPSGYFSAQCAFFLFLNTFLSTRRSLPSPTHKRTDIFASGDWYKANG